MFGKQKNSPQIDNAVAKGVNFEVSIADIARRSEKRAWTVAGISIFIVIVMLGGLIYILPLKREVPYLIMADAYTGQATVATLRGDFNSPHSITQSEALNRANVAQYIVARESFDVAMMNMRDWDLVHVMSSRDVAAGYDMIHSKNNPDRPFKVYGTEHSIRVKILSIQLEKRGQGDNARNDATIRFQRMLYDKKTGALSPIDSKIARMEFTYKANLAMDEQQRYNNPLGFQVVEYTVDNDFAASPPVEHEVTPQAGYPQAGYPQGAPPQGYPAQGQPVPGQPVAYPQGQPVPAGQMQGQPAQGYPPGNATPVFEGAMPVTQPQSYPTAPAGTAPAPQAPAPNQVNGVGKR